MKVLHASVYNFASYRHLDFSFTDQGLTLVSGPTGSGKSTLCDVIPWILFGVTAKNGSVDEIRSWNTDQGTKGILVGEVNGKQFEVRRTRGVNNDLEYTGEDCLRRRGKDLNDTQKQINQLLNMSAETYLAGAYLHEFSQTAQFFTLSAKNRRVITEQLADLSLAKSLQEKLTTYNKELKAEKAQLCTQLSLDKSGLEYLKSTRTTNLSQSKDWIAKHNNNLKDTEARAEDFNNSKDKEINMLKSKYEEWELERQDKIPIIEREIQQLEAEIQPTNDHKETILLRQIEHLKSQRCGECGAPKTHDQLMITTKELYDTQRKNQESKAKLLQIDTLNARLSRINTSVNPYIDIIYKENKRENLYLEQLEKLKTEVNPYLKVLESASEVIGAKELSIQASLALEKDISIEQSDIELLLETIATFRSVCIENTTVFLQHTTNKLLEDHFDAELRVTLSAEGADKIDVEITKDGNLCSFSQLSKGQRQILKLCFGVAVMQSISNYNGTHFNCVFFDEALDGMDEAIKAKSFTLLEKLALKHESVFCVEHSESFKSLFTNRYDVELINGSSELEKA